MIELSLPSVLFPQEAKTYITVINLLIVALILQWDHFPIINLISSTRRDFFLPLGVNLSCRNVLFIRERLWSAEGRPH